MCQVYACLYKMNAKKLTENLRQVAESVDETTVHLGEKRNLITSECGLKSKNTSLDLTGCSFQKSECYVSLRPRRDVKRGFYSALCGIY